MNKAGFILLNHVEVTFSQSIIDQY